MEADDINGTGVERIRLNGTATGTFSVGVATFQTSAAITARLVVSQGSRTLSDVSAVVARKTLWEPAVVTINAAGVSVTSTNTFETAEGECLGDAATPTDGFGAACTQDTECRSDLRCGDGICTTSCFFTGVCSQCTTETATNCSCGQNGFCIPGA